jgi:hypothetical protein
VIQRVFTLILLTLAHIFGGPWWAVIIALFTLGQA